MAKLDEKKYFLQLQNEINFLISLKFLKKLR